MGNLNINENLGKIVKKAARFLKKLENFLNRKIRAAPLTAAPDICISSELLPLFLFYLAAPHRAARASVQWALRSLHICAARCGAVRFLLHAE